jgi:hypothetical protein
MLALAECILWLVAGLVQWNLANFSLGPVYSPQVAEAARKSLTEFAWGVLNVACLVAYYLRAGSWGRWLMAAIQLANLAVTLYLGFGTVSCGENGFAGFWLAAFPGGSLALQYLLWRRIDHRPGSSPPLAALRTPITLAIVVVALAVGAALAVAGWRLSLYGIESHSGTVSTVTTEQGTLSVTIDASPRVYTISDYAFEPVPLLRPGERVVILTGEACNYGSPLAVQSARGLWIDSIYGEAVRPYAPFNWGEHETLRWSLLSIGLVIELLSLLAMVLWIG